MACENCPMPMDNVSPSPETPKHNNSLLAAFAPVATEGIRPCTALNPCDWLAK